MDTVEINMTEPWKQTSADLLLIGRPESCRMPTEGARKASEPRLVTVRRAGVEVGVTLCGGNLRGVYIDSLDEDSPARGPEGLLPGDLILEVGAPHFPRVLNGFLMGAKPAD